MRNIGGRAEKGQVTMKVTLGRNFLVGHSEKSESSVKMAKNPDFLGDMVLIPMGRRVRPEPSVGCKKSSSWIGLHGEKK